MMGEKVEITLYCLRPVGLHVERGALVKVDTQRVRKALVGNLAGDDVAEQPGASLVLVRHHQVCGVPDVEVAGHIGFRAEVRVNPPNRRCLETPTENASDLDGSTGRLVEGVDPAQQKTVEAGGEFDGVELLRAGRIEPATVQEVEDLFQVKRIPLGSRDNGLDQLRRRLNIVAVQLGDLGVCGGTGRFGPELGELELIEEQEGVEAQSTPDGTGRPIVDEEQNGEMFRPSDQDFEEISRQWVDAMAVL